MHPLCSGTHELWLLGAKTDVNVLVFRETLRERHHCRRKSGLRLSAVFEWCYKGIAVSVKNLRQPHGYLMMQILICCSGSFAVGGEHRVQHSLLFNLNMMMTCHAGRQCRI
jgi:hypothetical protein